ncbi:acyl dehydratase [Pseudomonas sp. LB-090624]|uniref:MaoC family dehydratase n=1 Tax=Pseudomonas sp. LB-090624 TaxID=2213079 RepID=UPI000D8BA9D3|nr:MaoC family dehydratase [Pseudomonas sp. LB-090624]PYB76597.1 acyl dehydratase [Pseudomonas sp. LB-090624]
MSEIRRKAVEGLQVGDTFSIKRTFTHAEVASFEQISRDQNPIHSHPDYAKARGFKGTIAHGLLTASLVTEIGGQLGWLAASMSFGFKRPVYPGEALTCEWRILSIDESGRAEADIKVQNQGGELVMTARTTGVVPNEVERAMLRSILDEQIPVTPSATPRRPS